MATQSASTTTKGQKPPATSAGKQPTRATGSASTASGTPERNETYGLVSVLYHALQGAETYTQYINDAKQAGDQELVDFFEDCRDELNDQALRARQLLATRLEDDIDEDDEDADDEDADDEDEDED